MYVFSWQVPHTAFSPLCPPTRKAAAPSAVLVCIMTQDACYAVGVSCRVRQVLCHLQTHHNRAKVKSAWLHYDMWDAVNADISIIPNCGAVGS